MSLAEPKAKIVTADGLREHLASFMSPEAVPSVFTLGRWARLRRIPSIRAGRRVLFDLTAVEEEIRSWEVKAQ